ncbi:MAG: ferrous iron transport protein A [Akkermansia sp.]|nr:ferrous iron transport protein A [Akkermansia sp.]
MKIDKTSTSATLRDAKAGQTVKVARITGSGSLRQRILDMGLTKGTEVSIRKVAPLGDPLEITVRGYELSLRKAEAARIELA